MSLSLIPVLFSDLKNFENARKAEETRLRQMHKKEQARKEQQEWEEAANDRSGSQVNLSGSLKKKAKGMRGAANADKDTKLTDSEGRKWIAPVNAGLANSVAITSSSNFDGLGGTAESNHVSAHQGHNDLNELYLRLGAGNIKQMAQKHDYNRVSQADTLHKRDQGMNRIDEMKKMAKKMEEEEGKR